MFIESLALRAGSFDGKGTNHEGQSFTGHLTIAPVVNSRGITISFSATGEDGTPYHQELSLIALNMEEKLCLWNLNSNMPGLVEHVFRREETLDQADHSFVFGFGKIEDKAAFREEVYIDLWKNGDISYRYFWGMPSGEFLPRSGVRMKPVGHRGNEGSKS